MASEQDTDRMAGELLNLLKGSIGKPTPGPTSRPQADDNTTLNMIKDILKQNLPSGPKPREQATAPKPQAPVASPQYGAASGEVQAGGWEGLFRRQGSERDSMHERHERERAELHQRHIREMEAAMTGQGAAQVAAQPTQRRSVHSAAPTQIPITLRHVSGT